MLPPLLGAKQALTGRTRTQQTSQVAVAGGPSDLETFKKSLPCCHVALRAARSRAGTLAAMPDSMTSTGGKAGFGIAWLLGIPLPILLVVYLISRC